MSIITDSYSITLDDPGLIRIEYRSRRDTAAGPLTRNTSIWFERTNLRWLVESLRQCITIYGQPELSTQQGNDHLKVFESGPEPAPYINVENKRPDGVEHPGFTWFAMSKPLAEELTFELDALL